MLPIVLGVLEDEVRPQPNFLQPIADDLADPTTRDKFDKN